MSSSIWGSKKLSHREGVLPSTASGTFTALRQEIEAARSIEELRGFDLRMLDLAMSAARTDAATRGLVLRISQLNDAITLRLIFLLDKTEGIRLPEGAAFLALGSEGRGEQTLRTDQDSAIVFIDDLRAAKHHEIDRFSNRLVEALEAIGVPRCPGNIMASNPRWRHSVTEWKRLLDHWIAVPTPAHMLNFGIFHGLRALHGDKGLEKQLHDHIRAAARSHSLFFPHMARHALRFPPPLTLLGRFRFEQSGEHQGKIDIKKAGLFAVTVGASLLALEIGSIGGSTWEKLELLGDRGVLASGDLAKIEEAFTQLIRFRLQCQLRGLAANGKPTDHIDPLVMTDRELHQFRQALKGINPFRRIMKSRYQLDFISR